MTLPNFMPRLRTVLLAVGALCLAGLAAAPVVLAQAPAVPLNRFGFPSFAPLVKQVLPAVVNIAVLESVGGAPVALPPELRGTPFEQQFRNRFRNRRDTVMGAGSGFIIDPSGIIVTNNHVVGHADRIQVSLADGTELPATLIGTDEATDIAVIRVQTNKPLPFVNWGDSRAIEVGDWIIAAGNPFGLGGSITAGIVSARGREIGAGPFDDFIQIDAPINPGNSGGPTFSLDGKVVGVNTAIVAPGGGSVGIGFAVPSELAARVVAELRERGRIDRGWLGVVLQEGSTGPGVLLGGVDRNSPAARAGLKAGDIVLAMNGEKIESARILVRGIASMQPGAAVRLLVRRGGRDTEVPVTVGKRPPQQAD